MLNQPTLEKLQTMKLYGMADAFRAQMETTDTSKFSFEERFAMLVDQQWLWKENRALARRLRAAKLKERGVVEEIDYQHPRGLDRKLIRTLANSEWVRQHQNLLLIGPTGIGKTWLGCEDVSEVLEYVPARFKVIRHVRPKLSCTKCDASVQAEAPSRPIARGLACPGLLAHVLVSKYADHLPLYRQAGIYAREGVELERSTLADWVGATSELLKPLKEALRQYVMSAHKLHADDTPVPVLAPGDGKTKSGR